MTLSLDRIAAAADIVMADLRATEPARYSGLHDLAVYREWTNDGPEHAEVGDWLHANTVTAEVAAAMHVVLDAGYHAVASCIESTP